MVKQVLLEAFTEQLPIDEEVEWSRRICETGATAVAVRQARPTAADRLRYMHGVRT